MNRRSFLCALGLGAVGAAVSALEIDPERLLWTPGQKTFFIPEAPKVYAGIPGYVASVNEAIGPRNNLLTIDIITRETLKILENNLIFTRRINREYDAKFGWPGSVIELRPPTTEYIGPVIPVRMIPQYEFGFTIDREGRTGHYERKVRA